MRKAILALLPLLCACEGEAEKAVRHGMIDPDAAQFRDVRACSGDGSVWRGDVNGKNTFGAYTGFKPFFYSEYSVSYAESSNFTALMERCYSDLKPDDLAETPSADSLGQAIKLVNPSAKPKSAPDLTEKVIPKMDEEASDEDLHTESFDSDSRSKPDRCWADYCPCDTSNPDYGYIDIPLCRNIRMGVAVSDAEFSIGASGRDARKALREFKESDQQ